MRLRLTIIWVILLAGIVSRAASNDLRFRHYTTENGLPSDCIRDILQDDAGYIWIANDGGVTRYDGSSFATYVLRCQHDNIRNLNYPLVLHQLNGELWVGTDLHLFRYNPQTDAFDCVVLDLGDANPKTEIRSMTSDRDGNMWLSIGGRGVYRVKPGANGLGEITNIPMPQVNNVVNTLYVDSRNDLWAISNQRDGGIFKFDKRDGRFKPFELQIDGKRFNLWVRDITEDPGGKMWIGTWKGDLMSFDPYTGDARHYQPLSADGVRLDRINSLRSIEGDRLLVGSDAGLGIYDARTDHLDLYKYDETDPYSMSDQFVYSIQIDHEGGIWVGTYYGGVNYLMPDLKHFERYQPSSTRNAVSGNVISAFIEDPRGNIYIASDDGGLSRYNVSTDTFDHLPMGDGNPDNLHALMLDGDDLWIGSYSDGVYVLDTNSGAIRNYTTTDGDDHSLPDNDCYALLLGRDATIWVASGSNLCRYDRANDRFDRVRDLNAQIVDIDEDDRGTLWLSTQGDGLYTYSPKTDSWKCYRQNGNAGDLAHNHVNAVDIDARRNVWVATTGGLCRYVPETDRFEIVDLGIGVGELPVMSVVTDQGTLWLATQYGLARYRSDGHSDVYTLDDGLTSSQFMPNAILRASNGRIYVGSRRGFTAFMPYQVQNNQLVPRVVFTGIEIDNKPVAVGDQHLPVAINQLDHIDLHHDDATFAISFASLSYVNPEKNQYSYMLEGFDHDWTMVGDINKAVYTNLPVGHYTFKVRASNSDNVWSEPIEMRINVMPPWYRAWYMQLLYGVAILCLLVFVVYYIHRRSEQKHKTEIARLNSSKEIEVYQAKLSFFTMIAHEIRTPVTLIIGPIEKMMRHVGQLAPGLSKDLSVIDRNSQRLLYLVNQLLDFKKVEQTELHVEYRPTRIVDLVRSVTDRFIPTLEQKGITLELDMRVPDDFTADIDSEAVTKMVSNLMNNARKFTRDHITVTVTADQARDTFTISVADNGIGVSKNNQKRIFVPFFQVTNSDQPSQGGTGIGLSIVKAAVEAHGGSIAIDSDLGKGATMIATMPIHQATTVTDEPLPEEQPGAVGADEAAVESQERPTMLVVDDNEELCTFITNNFEDKYRVLKAENGVEALEVLRDHGDVSLIISDWMMPKMDGVELCRAVRADRLYSHIPFVLLTAKTDNYSKIEGLNCGADAYIEKPFSLQVLDARISNLLQMREMLRAKFSGSPLEPIQSIASTPVDNDFLTRLDEIIEANFSNPDLSVDLLAEKMDISRSGLYAKIKSLADVTPNDLIKIARLKKAAQLLAEGRYRINEVCYMVGFNSPSYFAKCFAKQFGMTPGDFHP